MNKLLEIFQSYPAPSDYTDAKRQSAEIDLKLGYRILESEAELREREARDDRSFQSWSQLQPQAFQTPYSELIELVTLLNPVDQSLTWVDLGAGYGRLGFVLNAFAPLSEHIGYEAAPERVREANRVAGLWGLGRTRVDRVNLADPGFFPVRADVYFIYDYGNLEEIRKTLDDLRTLALQSPIRVIGRGVGIQNEIDRNIPWLTVKTPHRLPHSTIYIS